MKRLLVSALASLFTMNIYAQTTESGALEWTMPESTIMMHPIAPGIRDLPSNYRPPSGWAVIDDRNASRISEATNIGLGIMAMFGDDEDLMSDMYARLGTCIYADEAYSNGARIEDEDQRCICNESGCVWEDEDDDSDD